MPQPQRTTSNPNEIKHFQSLAHTWWDEDGAFAAIHALNPLRLQYIKDHIAQGLGQDFQNISVLDIGCGGGLLSEPIARMGACVTGIDATPENIENAKIHAIGQDLSINYICQTIESFCLESQNVFDVVTAMEILEHVDNPDLFIQSSAETLRSGGLFFVSTFHRTLKSFALGIVMAEYVLRWAPRGTHTWKKFMKPSELTDHAKKSNLRLLDLAGVRYNILRSKWELCSDPNVNYMAVFQKN